jgi:hypothetical protein
MKEPSSHEVQGQVKRAQRLRAQIERLKGAQQDDKASGSLGSLREQIEQRAAEQEKIAERKRRK